MFTLPFSLTLHFGLTLWFVLAFVSTLILIFTWIVVLTSPLRTRPIAVNFVIFNSGQVSNDSGNLGKQALKKYMTISKWRNIFNQFDLRSVLLPFMDVSSSMHSGKKIYQK